MSLITIRNLKITSDTNGRISRITWCDEFDVVDNKQNIQASAGAGIQAAQIVADHDADVLIADNCGTKAFMTLKAADIKLFVGLDGTVREAIEFYKDGKLELAEGANVEAHSGIQ